MQNPNIHRLLAAAKSVKQSDDTSWTCYCPVHESGGGVHNNSLSVSAAEDGRILVNCHNGCDPRDVIYAFGLTWQDCFPPKEAVPQSRITATYDYIDEDGILKFQVCRLEPGRNGSPKDFRQRQPDGKGDWTWKTKGVKKFPYRLPELLASTGPILIVEGEKQVDYLRSLGMTATCNPGGAGKWLKSFGKYFANRDVLIVPDCDPPNTSGLIVGVAHAKEVADFLLSDAQSIRVIELPDAQEKWGLDDWLQKGGHTLQEFSDLANKAKPWGPDSAIVTNVNPAKTDDPLSNPLSDESILAACGITYVAQHDDTGFVEIFSKVTQRFTTIRDPSAIKYEQMVLSVGSDFRATVRRNEQDPNKLITFPDFKLAIAAIASRNSALTDKMGIGIWENKDSLVLVNSRQLGILNGKPEIDITDTPVYNQTAYDVGDRCEWVNLQRLKADVDSVKAKPGSLHREEIQIVRDLFAKWQYLAPKNVFPEVLTGMILATFTQTLWAWRPQIFLTGQAYAGKSTMFKMIAAIFGPLCKMSSNSSAAGLRQFLSNSGRIVLCDELEKSRHRRDILEMIRASGRGDESFRGTANHQYRGFRLQHIFWCASIESGLQNEADQSRFIVAELKKVDAKIEMPTNEQLTEIGQKLAAVAVCSFRAAKELVDHLLNNKPQGIHGRICESYSVPCAMYAVSTEMDQTEALTLFYDALYSLTEAADIESDSEALLDEIMCSTGRIQMREKKTVADLLKERYQSTCEQDLRNLGVYSKGDELLLNCRALVNNLLSPEWKEKRIDTLLLRIPGAKRVVQRFDQTVLRFISIPRAAIPVINVESDSYSEKISETSFEQQAKNEGKSQGLFDIV